MTTLMRHQTAFILSINIVTQNDTSLSFSVVPIVSLGWLIMALWRLQRIKNSVAYNLALLTGDIKSRATIVGKLFTIGFAALSFGLGVSL